ncbi:MAG: gamma-glutamyltransferase [Chloroflexota bacterium]
MTTKNWRELAGTQFGTTKQMATGSQGVVAANHPLGAAAGMQMLARGGNAIDAAVATLFALNVVEPMMVGLFGAGWTHLRLADGRNIVIDNYSTTPAAATPDLYTPISDEWPDYMQTEGSKNMLGHLACGVPGTLKAWCELLENYGTLDLETVLQPAIQYAEDGFRATPYLHDCTAYVAAEMAQFEEICSIFMPNGQPINAGDLVRQPDLAESLRGISDHGSDYLYDGPLGEQIIEHIQQNSGIMTMADLRDYQTFERQVLHGSYRGYEILVPPPPCSGGAHILQMLNMLEGFDVAGMGFGSAESIHLVAEALKIAFADRAQHMGDPDLRPVPTGWLISRAYGQARQADIAMEQASTQQAGLPPAAESADTTHVTTADHHGNIVCMTQTINQIFGSKVMVPGTGVILNNTMALFDPHPGQANSVGSQKRMVSSMCPTIVLKDGEPFMSLGTPGGVRIFPSVFQAILNVIDHGMTLQEAVEAPRVWTQGQDLEVEKAIPQTVRQDLKAKGHTPLEVMTVAGGMNGVMFDPDSKLLHGAACWRGDGTAIGLGGGLAKPGIRFVPDQRKK